ncbi:hypothetical protein WQE_16009 [Paraburkholderia hospita]|uniref:Uncharacterized protein n=1 Tax=Paraburkholderia hospita TaxID=169430 RepID=A0ABN0FMS2_9BURK|nr:hypothetical protein [Paraburkholderia hospita]EIN00044.1 hypothetical protein WQE_16009 [Paraburkholderia hospita]OUL87844.1 hypothetical protein CA602_12890 [Paraburkholderia hospita]
MTQQKPSTPVGKLFLRCAASAAFGAAVSYTANHLSTPVLAPLAQWLLHRREFASPHIGIWLFAALVMTALLFAASVATEKRRDAFLDALAARGQRLTWWLLGGAAKAVCFLSGALAGFGGKGWLAGLLMLVMYGVVIGAVHGLVVAAQAPARPRS